MRCITSFAILVGRALYRQDPRATSYLRPPCSTLMHRPQQPFDPAPHRQSALLLRTLHVCKMPTCVSLPQPCLPSLDVVMEALLSAHGNGLMPAQGVVE